MPDTAMDSLLAYVARYPTKAAAARSMGVSKQFLGRVIEEVCPISPKLLAKLGLTRVIVKHKGAA